MNKRLRFVFVAVCLLAATLPGCRKEEDRPTTLRLYAGAGLRLAVDEMIAEFTSQTGIAVEPDYGGSGMVLTRAQADSEADLFMPGDVWYVDRLQAKAGLVESKTRVAYFVPVIIVRKGNPKGIAGLADLLREDVRVALGNPKGPRVGQITKELFAKSGLDVSRIDAMESATVNELGVWVKEDAADAALVWRAIAANLSDAVDIIEIPRDRNVFSTVVVGLMTTSTHKAEAQQFIDFMTGPTGRSILIGRGYQVEAP